LHFLALSHLTTPFFSVLSALFCKNTRVRTPLAHPNLNVRLEISRSGPVNAAISKNCRWKADAAQFHEELDANSMQRLWEAVLWRMPKNTATEIVDCASWRGNRYGKISAPGRFAQDNPSNESPRTSGAARPKNEEVSRAKLGLEFAARFVRFFG
jgi:hypothetical protein